MTWERVLIDQAKPWKLWNKLELIIVVSLVFQMVKNLPVIQETQAQSLSWEGPLEKEMVIHFSILAWEIPWTEEPDGL